MIIDQLTVCDFGVFNGEHVIDLRPRTKYGKERPIILFGGLNGAGKTTILNAVRLVLYGKQSLGPIVAQKTYDEYLRESIHHNPSSIVKANGASITLDFEYAKYGKTDQYSVRRAWVASGKQIKETLSLTKNGEAVSEISKDQCQGFLNELVPIGVSDLFFFDGERIAELAEEDGSAALGEAIRRLLGLYLIERTQSDLNVFIRRQRTNTLPTELQEKLKAHKSKYDEHRLLLEKHRIMLAELSTELSREQEILAKKEDKLTSKGGDWASDRSALKAKRAELEKQRVELQNQLREELGGIYPLTLAPELLLGLEDQLVKEKELKEWKQVATSIQALLPNLSNKLKQLVANDTHTDIDQVISDTFVDYQEAPKNLADTNITHDLSDSDTEKLRNWIREATQNGQNRAESLKEKLESLEDGLAAVSLQIDRAPESDSLVEDLASIRESQTLIAKLEANLVITTKEARDAARYAIEETRAMKKIELELHSESSATTITTLADSTKELLKDFSEEINKRKLGELEIEFYKSFTRLARKDDILSRAKINPYTFDVTLFGKNDKIIRKKQLSAGEKQVYAIAMLEALARTSGRHLPLIIDTPLGRLDSHHRKNLINNYFPNAGHQVLILSTDTEVDESFYSQLSPHISHAFNIEYGVTAGGSTITEGYFWKDNERKLANAS